MSNPHWFSTNSAIALQFSLLNGLEVGKWEWTSSWRVGTMETRLWFREELKSFARVALAQNPVSPSNELTTSRQSNSWISNANTVAAKSHLYVRMKLTADIDLHKEHFAISNQAKQKSHLPYAKAWPLGFWGSIALQN